MDALTTDPFKFAEENFMVLILFGVFIIYGLDHQVRKSYGRTSLRAGPLLFASIAGILAAYGYYWDRLESDWLKAGGLMFALLTVQNIRRRDRFSHKAGINTSIVQGMVGLFIGICSVIYLEAMVILIFIILLAKAPMMPSSYNRYPWYWGSSNGDDGDRIHDYRGDNENF